MSIESNSLKLSYFHANSIFFFSHTITANSLHEVFFALVYLAQKYDTLISIKVVASALMATCTTTDNCSTHCCRRTNVQGCCCCCCIVELAELCWHDDFFDPSCSNAHLSNTILVPRDNARGGWSEQHARSWANHKMKESYARGRRQGPAFPCLFIYHSS